MLLQIVLVVAMLACGAVVWDGFDKSQGWKMALFGCLAIGLFVASCTIGPKQKAYDCDTWGRFASTC